MLIGWWTDLLLKSCSKHSLNIFVSAIDTELMTKSYFIYWLFLSCSYYSKFAWVWWLNLTYKRNPLIKKPENFSGDLRGRAVGAAGEWFGIDCSQSPISSWDRLDIPRLTVTAIWFFKCTEGAGVRKAERSMSMILRKNRGQSRFGKIVRIFGKNPDCTPSATSASISWLNLKERKNLCQA